jgi:hypothetical protein
MFEESNLTSHKYKVEEDKQQFSKDSDEETHNVED